MAAFFDLYPDSPTTTKTTRNFRDIYSLSDSKFYRLYRFDKNTFSDIVYMIRPDIQRPTSRSYALSCDEQTAAALRYYATGSFQMDVGEGLNISQSSVHRAVMNVNSALNKRFDRFVTWPDLQQIRQNKIQFHSFGQFPNVILSLIHI